MKIISGKFKGRKIKIPKNLSIRPTTNLAKESLFNIISNNLNLEDINVLDLFSGSGMMGLEFISRGSKVTFLDHNVRCIKHISRTLNHLKTDAKSIKQNAFKYLASCNDDFDLVFADPPYSFSDENYYELIDIISKKILKKPNNFFILEHFKKKNFLTHENFFETRNYGDCSFTFFKQKSG